MSARTSTYEPSIVLGDEQEQNRIQMEQRLQHTEISFHLSSNNDDCSDVEYPRHRSDPHRESFSGLPSFEHPSSRDAFQANDHTAPWSYRDMDDDDGVHPFVGETVSTVGHHASALTLSAGLGGRGARRDISLSGAEYDPDRPIQGIMAGLGARYNTKPASKSSQSKGVISTVVDFDPLVVEDTDELDNILQTCNIERSVPVQSSISSGSSSASGSGRATLVPQSPRPTLTDALSRGHFSPQRPRNPQLNSGRRTPNSIAHGHSSIRGETPRRGGQSLSYVSQLPSAMEIDPAVNIQPPTPMRDDKTVRFTGKSRTKTDARTLDPPVATHPQTRRSPLAHYDASQHQREHHGNITADQSMKTPRSALRNKVHLPDVTGLTSAVASPAQRRLDYFGININEEKDVDAQLVATLSTLQSKLTHLETENSISRRRVRELEFELEECKKEVARERTKILEHSIPNPPKEKSHGTGKTLGRTKANLRSVSFDPDIELTQKRYQEAVEEKKALEGLIGTLRSHLSRLTAELSDHRKLLSELRALRDRDARALKEKSTEVDRLRHEVERLAGEVEVLRGVVEEGLKERREVKEQNLTEANHADDTSEVVDDDKDSDDGHSDVSVDDTIGLHSRTRHASLLSPPSSRPGSPPPVSRPVAQKEREDEEPFISSAEMERISQELSERRTERSISALSAMRSPQNSRRVSSSSQPRSDSPVNLPENLTRRTRNTLGAPDSKNDKPTKAMGSQKVAGPTIVVDPPSQASGSTLPRTTQRPRSGSSARNEQPQEIDPLLSRIPAPRVECMGGVSHNPQTCTVCHRHSRQRKPSSNGEQEPWIRELNDRIGRTPNDAATAQRTGRDLEDFVKQTRNPTEDKLPPQTVLTKVLRELEDDFTHYKAIYAELADQYRVVDAASNPAKRNVLADHLRDVIDLLEQKGDQIASLYDLLTFKDKSIPQAQKS